MLVIDADRRVLGRMASEAAKAALMGEEVVIVNAEKAYVSGNMRSVFRENRDKLEIKNKGNVNKGPYHPKRPDVYVRKSVRGMLPWKSRRGREAYKRIRAYIGIPEDELKRNNIPVPEKSKPRKKLRRKVTVAEICSHIGGSW
ncbi:MAG: 50S ribosomal protein L13 [Candidatus Altiarchaeales archaeon]|nr:50S ribosomal protein L13 [Candidatus Altiarchaeales archaeon]MBD3415687.1 50S ribosomal protein L13 [Candidatus Altiarchaeales archaeon]